MADDLSAICTELGYSHLTEAASAVSFSQCVATLAASGRPALLKQIAAELPSAKLPERQKIATAISKQGKPPPPPPPPLDKEQPPRILFLHGYGTCPEIMMGAVEGLKKALPECDIHILRGFETIDEAHPPTAAAILDPQNAGLERIAKWAERTKKSLHCWSNFREPLPHEREKKPRSYYSFTSDAAQLEYASDAAGMRTACSKLLKHINEDEKGYDLVCGFSQGGEVTLLLASHVHEFTHAKRRPYRFALFGSELPLVLCLEPDLSFEKSKAAPTKPDNAVACFAVMGLDEPDETTEGFAESVSSCMERGLKIKGARWKGDHKMPPAGDPCYVSMVKHLFPERKPPEGEEAAVVDVSDVASVKSASTISAVDVSDAVSAPSSAPSAVPTRAESIRMLAAAAKEKEEEILASKKPKAEDVKEETDEEHEAAMARRLEIFQRVRGVDIFPQKGEDPCHDWAGSKPHAAEERRVAAVAAAVPESPRAAEVAAISEELKELGF